MEPKISVIVPVYNVGDYLDRFFRNIVSQTFSDFELIIVDDGSTDAGGTMCDLFADKDDRVRVFHKENGGVSSAREYGLKEASGEFIVYCDPDDYVDKTFLECLYTKGKEADSDMVICDFVSSRFSRGGGGCQSKPKTN